MPDARYEGFKISLGKNTTQNLSPITTDSLKDIPLSYATVSIGRSGNHSLSDKLRAISSAGFSAIELGFPDLVTFAKDYLQQNVEATDYDELCMAAMDVKSTCDDLGLKILMLQPFTNFEGWPAESEERKSVFEKAKNWMRVMEALGCDMLQVGSADTPKDQISTDRDRIVADLTELADLLATKGMRIAYENWCWSTHAPDWDDVWFICKAVNRENFGLCLDTFQSAGGEWADPTTSSGLVERDGVPREQMEDRWKESCERLAEIVKADKIFILQISDAYKPPAPLSKETISGARPRARWSKDFRPLPFEGYLPVVDFTKAVLHTGFRGYFSYEIFDSGPYGTGRADADDLEQWAKNARECHRRLGMECVDG